jgi:hypothetical protein
MTLSALSRDTSSSRAAAARFLLLLKQEAFLSILDQGSLRKSSGGIWFHQPSIRSLGHPTMIHFSDTAISRGSKAPNQPSDELASTRVASKRSNQRIAPVASIPTRTGPCKLR